MDDWSNGGGGGGWNRPRDRDGGRAYRDSKQDGIRPSRGADYHFGSGGGSGGGGGGGDSWDNNRSYDRDRQGYWQHSRPSLPNTKNASYYPDDRPIYASSRPQDYRGVGEHSSRELMPSPSSRDDRDWDRGRDRDRGQQQFGYNDRSDRAEARTSRAQTAPSTNLSLASLLNPFQALAIRLPPHRILRTLLRGPAAIASGSAVATSFPEAVRQINPSSYQWTRAHSTALDRLLRTIREAASDEVGSIDEDTMIVAVQEGQDEENAEMAGTGTASSNAKGTAWKSTDPSIWTRSTRAKRILLANLTRLCAIAGVAERIGRNEVVDTKNAGAGAIRTIKGETPAAVSSGWTKGQTDQCLDLIYDFCEAMDQKTRLLGFAALSAICNSDPSLVRRNTDVLCQLLQVSNATERSAVHASLRKLLRSDLIPCLQTILSAETRASSEQRFAAVAFLAKEVVGDHGEESGESDAFGFGLDASAEEVEETHKPTSLRELIAGDVEAEICLAELCADVLCAIQSSRRPAETKGSAAAAAETDGDDAAMDETSDAKSSLKNSGFPVQIDEIYNLQIFLLGTDADPDTAAGAAVPGSSLLRTLFLPLDDFLDRKTHARSRRAAMSLFDALAVKGLQKTHDLLELQLAARQRQLMALGSAAPVQHQSLSDGDEITFLGAAAEDGVGLVQERLKVRAKLAKRRRKSMPFASASAAAAAAASSTEEDEELRLSEKEMGRISPTANFCQRQLARLFAWLCRDEAMWEGTADNHAMGNLQATYETLRSFLLGHELSPTTANGASDGMSVGEEMAPSASALQLFSSALQPALLRVGGVVALSRRKDAVQHGRPGAYDVSLSVSLASALIFATRPPQMADTMESERIESLEALLWALSLSLPLKPRRTGEKTVWIVEHAAMRELISAWRVSGQGLTSSLQHAVASAKDRTYLSALLDNIAVYCEQFLQDPMARRAVDERPIWLPPRIRLLPSSTWNAGVKDRARLGVVAPIGIETGGALARWNLKRRSGANGDDEEGEDATRPRISIRGVASGAAEERDAAALSSYKRLRQTIKVVAGAPTAMVSIRGTAPSARLRTGASVASSQPTASAAGGIAMRGGSNFASESSQSPAAPAEPASQRPIDVLLSTDPRRDAGKMRGFADDDSGLRMPPNAEQGAAKREMPSGWELRESGSNGPPANPPTGPRVGAGSSSAGGAAGSIFNRIGAVKGEPGAALGSPKPPSRPRGGRGRNGHGARTAAKS